jgi:alpha-tubulin suppressor-like RCC1 family protein
MPEPKAQLIDPQGPIDVPGLSVTGVTTATGGFVGQVQGAATGLASTTTNLSVGIITATKFQGNTTGNVSGLADGTNINVGIITSTSFTGDLVGNAAGLSTTTANIKAGILSATSFAGNFTGVASGITGTPNIVVGIMTGTLKGDGSSLTGIAATNWIANNVTANSSTTAVDLSDGNVVKFTQSADTTVSFANTGTSNIVTFIRIKDDTSTARAITWPSAIKWNNGSAPTLNTGAYSNDANVIKLLTRDEGVTWYGWEDISFAGGNQLFAFGSSSTGQLAQGNGPNYSSPIQIPGTTWKSLVRNQLEHHVGAIKTDNTLWMWGDNAQGELGQNNRTQYSSPIQVPGTNWSSKISGTASGSVTVGTKTDGTLWAWGKNQKGVLGQNQGPGQLAGLSSPTQIPGTTWGYTDPYKIWQGYDGSMHITKTDGTLWFWGANENGVSGSSTRAAYSSPVQIPGTTWSDLSGARRVIMATKTDGTLWTWGNNTDGMLGHNNTTQRSSPVQVPGTTWDKVGSGLYASYAIKTDGTLWTWGQNEYGALGDNSRTKRSSPVQVPGTNWNDVVGGYWSTLASKTDGTLWSWGLANGEGGLGLNQASISISSPTQIPGTWSTESGSLTSIYFGFAALKSS